jgi:hypothetical protein
MLSHTPIGLDEIINTFGSLDDPQFETRNIVQFDLPYPLLYDGKQVLRASCHNLLVANFKQVFENIKAADLAGQVKNYSGIFARRPIRGLPSQPSTHS